MGDGLRIAKDKRQRSSSSLTGLAADTSRSERKLDIRASIPEIDDHFTLAEARCDDLQEKLDLVKGLKRKRKLKKRSMTRVSEPVPLETEPLITVRTRPKNSITGHVPRGFKNCSSLEVACGEDETGAISENESPNEKFGGPAREGRLAKTNSPKKAASAATNTMNVNKKPNSKPQAFRRRHVPKETPLRDAPPEQRQVAKVKPSEALPPWHSGMSPIRQGLSLPNRRVPVQSQHQHKSNSAVCKDERPIVELYNKDRGLSPMLYKNKESGINKKVREIQQQEEPEPEDIPEKEKEGQHVPRRVKYRSRGYELPTVASQMKQHSQRFYQAVVNSTNLPFVVSKSTAPSHNIGVNIQQVLNGIKVQQPLSGIPLTIAHHMGLGHVPFSDTKTQQQPSLDTHEINVIRVGRRLLRLPSYKFMSYNRLLSMYRESDGVVSRFLRAVGRPHCFYTSMYNLTMREDFDGVTSKGRAVNQEAKESLAEYASLYREYERLDKSLKDGCHDPVLERRRDEMARELAAREEHIRWVVQECQTRPDTEQVTLRASASTAEHGYRYSTFSKLNLGDAAL